MYPPCISVSDVFWYKIYVMIKIHGLSARFVCHIKKIANLTPFKKMVYMQNFSILLPLA